MSGPLDGLRIVDLSTVVMGPWATQMLADMGAEVIKVESPQGDITRQMGPALHPGMAAVFLCTNRNKRSVVLDLKQGAAIEALLRLADQADVLLHNLRPRAAAKLGLEYSAFSQRNPRLVYCAAFGFGSRGPLADNPAYDDVIQSACGLADLVGSVSDQPRYVPSIVADKTTAYAVVSAVTAALLQRVRTGRGQQIEVTMYETMADFALVEHLCGATFDPPIGPMGYARIMTPERRPFRSADGQFLTVLPYTDRNWRDFFRIAHREELAHDPAFATMASRVKNAGKVYATLAEMVAKRHAKDLIRDLQAAQIPVMRVQSIQELIDDPQLAASGFWRTIDHPTEGRLRLTAPPIRFGESLDDIRLPPPRLGEHSREILLEAGYAPGELDQLIEKGVTHQAPAAFFEPLENNT
ncbi:MAG: CoA transferase [Verrucomicrobiota bacterium]|jgi:crotonobetainyl-CoA:carnitine CoA-transferase CaiB-like acyl-CoA transferase